MVRIKDIAKEAGVSPTTVSNVIHGNTKKVSKANIDKIQKILEEHQYIPSMSALMLAENRSRLIGVLIGGVDGKRRSIAGDPFTSIMLSALELEIYRKNYYMLFHMSSTPEENWKLATTWKVEGLITLGLTAEQNIELQKRCQIPLVSIDNYYGGKERLENIGLQDFEGGFKMGNYLIENGMKKILFLSDNDIGVDHERWLGLQRAAKESELVTAKHWIMPTKLEFRMQWLKDRLEEIGEWDALFFASDRYAQEGLLVLQDMGVCVPEDISVVGFDDSPYARMCRPQLTTVRQDVMEKGKMAVKKLISLIKEEEFSGEERLPVELVLRDSVQNLK